MTSQSYLPYLCCLLFTQALLQQTSSRQILSIYCFSNELLELALFAYQTTMHISTVNNSYAFQFGYLGFFLKTVSLTVL